MQLGLEMGLGLGFGFEFLGFKVSIIPNYFIRATLEICVNNQRPQTS